MDESDIARATERDLALVEKGVNAISRVLSEGDTSARDCIDCGDPIPEPRLRAAPWTKRCVHCQQSSES